MTDDEGLRAFIRAELELARLGPRPRVPESASEGHVVAFEEWCRPMMALGTIPLGVRDCMVQYGVSLGLGSERAMRIIERIAAECGASLDPEDDLS